MEEEEEEEEEEEKIKEELGFFSPLDNINPYVSFKQALTGKRVLRYFWLLLAHILYLLAFQMRNPHIYQAGTTALDIEQQTLLMEVMRIAEQETNASS